MKFIAVALLLMSSIFNCGGEKNSAENVKASACNYTATVKDFTGLDGCGLMFELEDGTRLIPEHRVYIQAPTIDEDPLYHYTMTAGARVKISYKETDSMNVCMAGKTVFITCLTKIN